MQYLDFFKLWCRVLSMSRLETVSRPIWIETEIKTRPEGPRPRPRPRHDVTRPRRDQTFAHKTETKTKTIKTGLETVSRRDMVSRLNITGFRFGNSDPHGAIFITQKLL